MPRMRTLKPSFFSNDQLAEIHPLGRLLFQGLWCMADREGRLEDRPKRIKAEILPYDNANVERLLCELERRGFIVRYDVQGNQFIQIVNFLKHQNPHVKEPPSIIPAPDGHGAGPVPPPNGHHESPSSRAGVLSHGSHEQSLEQEQEHVVNGASTVPASPAFSADDQTRINGVRSVLTPFGLDGSLQFWRKVLDTHGELDLEAEAFKQADWLRRNNKHQCSELRYLNWLEKAPIQRPWPIRPNVAPVRTTRADDEFAPGRVVGA